MARPSFTIEWDAHEYEHKERSADWYWAVGIVVIAIAVTSIIVGDVIFGILVLVGAFALVLYINRPPDTIHIVVDEKGVTRGHTRYPYDALHSFYIAHERSHPVILLRSKKLLMPLVHIPLGETNLERLHKVLLQYLPEEFFGHHLSEKLLEYFGF